MKAADRRVPLDQTEPEVDRLVLLTRGLDARLAQSAPFRPAGNAAGDRRLAFDLGLHRLQHVGRVGHGGES